MPQPWRIIAELRERVTELVRKLKAVLRPVSVPSGQSNRDTATWRTLEVGLWMIGTIMDINTA